MKSEGSSRGSAWGSDVVVCPGFLLPRRFACATHRLDHRASVKLPWIEHLLPGEHRRFYCSQRFTLNLARADMALAGHSPSVRLFEAAACGTPIITDDWEGLRTPILPLLADRKTPALDINVDKRNWPDLTAAPRRC